MAETSTRARRESGDLSALLLPELRKIATNLGIEGAAELKKPDLVTAITDLQAANREAAKAEREAKRAARNQKRRDNNSNETASSDSQDDDQDEDEMPSDNSSSNSNNSNNNNSRDNSRGDREWRRDRHRDRGRDRFRDRDRSNRGEREIVLSEDDVLLPVGGLLDILDNYAFLRTAGYLPGPNDVYVSLQQVRRYGLRKGDVVTGQVRQAREGEKREKFNALVRLDTINGMEPDSSKERVDFSKLVPLYPQDRLRLETLPNILTTRVIDLIAPIGKGQRGLIVSLSLIHI